MPPGAGSSRLPLVDRSQVLTLAPLALAAVLAVFLAFAAGGVLAGVLALLMVACVGGLCAVVLSDSDARTRELIGTAGRAFMVAVPAILTVYLSWSTGGFYVGPRAAVTLGLLAILVVQVALARRPLEGLTWPVAAMLAALGLYAAWDLASMAWSHSPMRAVIEFERTLMYLLVVLVFAGLRLTVEQLNWMVRLVLAGLAAVCVAGLASRVLPDVWHVHYLIGNKRLSYPLSYQNSLGFMATGGLLLAFHLTCDVREHVATRVLAAAVMPLLTATLLLTLSRGAIGVALITLPLYALLARPEGLISGAVATIGFCVAAGIAAYDADLLFTDQAGSAAAAAQGHHAARLIGAYALGAAVARAILATYDGGLVTSAWRVRITNAVLAAACAVGVLVMLAVDVPGRLSDEYHRFINTESTQNVTDVRSRLTDPTSPKRLQIWKAGRRGYREAKFKGHGAGTFPWVWSRNRPEAFNTTNAHSIFLEALTDLGLVGFLLIVGAIGSLLVLLAMRIRGPTRPLGALIFCAVLGWVLHVSVDWNWYMPAATVWVLALAGAAMSLRPSASLWKAPGPSSRAALGLGAVILAVPAVLLGASQAHMERAVGNYQDGDCPSAIDEARSASRLLPIRPEPHELIGYCHIRARRPREALGEMRAALKRDRGNWEFWYDVAIARAASGENPRRELEHARALDPLQLQVRVGLTELTVKRRAARRRAARRAEPPERFEYGYPQIL